MIRTGRDKNKVNTKISENIIMRIVSFLLIDSNRRLKLDCRFNSDKLFVETEGHVPFKDNGIHIGFSQHESLIHTEVENEQ